MNPDLLRAHQLERVASVLERYTKPAVAFWLSEPTESRRSKIGGIPLLPPDFAWPASKQRPLDFLLQIDLADIAGIGPSSVLPSSGFLTYFYDLVNQPWGYDPAKVDGFSVAFWADPLTVLTPPPSSECVLPQFALEFAAAETLPHYGSRAYDKLETEAGLSEAEWEQYFDLQKAYEAQFYARESGRHRLFGHSSNIQGDMQLEAALVTNGLYCGDSTGYHDPRARVGEASADDWTLLLQLDSEERADLMWGDAGMLYFWIRNQDLVARQFEKAWMTLQCG